MWTDEVTTTPWGVRPQGSLRTKRLAQWFKSSDSASNRTIEITENGEIITTSSRPTLECH